MMAADDVSEVVRPCPMPGCTEGLRVTVAANGRMVGYHGATIVHEATIPEPTTTEFRALQAYARANDVWSFEFARGITRAHGQTPPARTLQA